MMEMLELVACAPTAFGLSWLISIWLERKWNV